MELGGGPRMANAGGVQARRDQAGVWVLGLPDVGAV